MFSFIKGISTLLNKNKRLQRGYEGATTSQNFRWHTNTSLANLETQIGLETLRNRARQLVRDNAYAESAVSKISTNFIGTGIIPPRNQVVLHKNPSTSFFLKLFPCSQGG